MKRILVISVLTCFLLAEATVAQRPSEVRQAAERIAGEILVGVNSMDYLRNLAEGFGGRLSDSAAQFRAAGLKNVHLELGRSEQTVEKKTTGNQTASYEGVSFTYNSSLASEIKAETIPEAPLDKEDDKPDEVAPEHTAFTLIGPYASRYESSFFSPPEIHIYPIAGYKEALAVSKDDVKALEEKISTLKTILSERPTSSEKEIPFLPEIDAAQVLRARLKYIDFKNGKGIMFLSQYNTEPALINNQGLAYIFQGLTSDGLYYISASFPVSAPILPKDSGATSFEDYKLPDDFYQDYESNEKSYGAYATKIARKLEALPPGKYEPDLTLFEELIRSLYVKPQS